MQVAEIARVARGMQIAMGRQPCWRHPHPILRAPRVRGGPFRHAIVRDHLEAFLAHARESYDRGLPRYVERAFRAYLERRRRQISLQRAPLWRLA